MATAEDAPSLLDALSNLRTSVESWATDWRDVLLDVIDDEIDELERLAHAPAEESARRLLAP